MRNELRRIRWWHRPATVLVCALMVQPWGAYRLVAADITPGYTFTSGEANITHTKLNNSAAGTIATTFYSGKASAGANPTPGNYTFLGLDSVSGTYKRQTLDQWVFDHSGLLADRTAATVPSLSHTIFINDGGAYKQISTTNLFFGGSSFTGASNETRLGGVLQGGNLGSLTLSNLLGSLAAHGLPTNGDVVMVITENGRAVKGMTWETLFKSQTTATNFNGDHVIVSWDGTRLRGNRATNLIDGLTTTNALPTTNAALAVLQDGVLQKLFLDRLALLMSAQQRMTQSVYTATTNIAGSSGNWSNVTALGTSALAASLTPRSNAVTARVLVRVVLNAAAAGGSDPAMFRVTRGGVVIGVGDDDGASRTEAAGYLPNSATPNVTTWEFLDTIGPTNTTYQVQVKTPTGNTTYINRSSSDSNAENTPRLVSSITLTEVLQ